MFLISYCSIGSSQRLCTRLRNCSCIRTARWTMWSSVRRTRCTSFVWWPRSCTSATQWCANALAVYWTSIRCKQQWSWEGVWEERSASTTNARHSERSSANSVGQFWEKCEGFSLWSPSARTKGVTAPGTGTPEQMSDSRAKIDGWMQRTTAEYMHWRSINLYPVTTGVEHISWICVCTQEVFSTASKIICIFTHKSIGFTNSIIMFCTSPSQSFCEFKPCIPPCIFHQYHHVASGIIGIYYCTHRISYPHSTRMRVRIEFNSTREKYTPTTPT